MVKNTGKQNLYNGRQLFFSPNSGSTNTTLGTLLEDTYSSLEAVLMYFRDDSLSLEQNQFYLDLR